MATVAPVLNGCVAGPNYRLPKDAMANNPEAKGAFINQDALGTTPAALPPYWWHLYADPRLNELVAEALKDNTDVKVANADIERARTIVREVEAGRTVNTTIESTIDKTRQGGIDTLNFPDWSYSIGLEASYPLDLAGGIKRSIEAARAKAEEVLAERDATRIRVAAGVTKSYLAVCSANHSIAAARKVVAIQSATLADIHRLFLYGRDTAFDVSRSEAAVNQTIATIPPLIAQRQAALYALTALLGRPEAEFPRDVELCKRPPTLSRLLPIGDGVALIRRRPDVRAAEQSLAAATATIGIAVAQLYPQVSLGGNIGLAGPFSTFGSASNFGGQIGPLISWTFPNFSLADARIAEANAATKAAKARFDGTVLFALQQTETALNAYGLELQHSQDLKRARDSAAQAAEQAHSLFLAGQTGNLDILNAEASLAHSDEAVAASEAAVAADQVDVFLALGGGWQPVD